MFIFLFNMSPLNMIPTLYDCGFKDSLFFTPICGEMIQRSTIDILMWLLRQITLENGRSLEIFHSHFHASIAKDFNYHP